MKLLTNKIYVRTIRVEDKTAEGIFRVSSENYAAVNKGEVLGVGPDVTMVHPGDEIYFMPNAGFKVPNTDPIAKIIEETNVLAIL